MSKDLQEPASFATLMIADGWSESHRIHRLLASQPYRVTDDGEQFR